MDAGTCRVCGLADDTWVASAATGSGDALAMTGADAEDDESAEFVAEDEDSDGDPRVDDGDPDDGDWQDRLPCPDGNCVGTLEAGVCRVCGAS